MGWKPISHKIRDFTCIYIKDVGLSIFISENILFMVKGNKLPPMIYRKNITEPGFDIIETINNTCSKLITSPDKL